MSAHTEIDEESQKIPEEENKRWKNCYQNIFKALQNSQNNLYQDQKLARELTAQIVGTRREEDKAALASDEAVAHGLSRLRKDLSEDLKSLLSQAYFARVVTLENDKEIEFRLGTASFPEERIIDWRKAPISKLYYDYHEGEEFEESIQGRTREGFILLRRSYQGEEDNLNLIEFPKGSFLKVNGDWTFLKPDSHFSRSPSHDGHLPPILSLITPEQFQLICQNPNQSMIIEGIAGSGKTTVGLHRLAWLLHPDNGGFNPKQSVVVTYNRSLKAYIETTLPELGIKDVLIRTYSQWAMNLVSDILGPRPRGSLENTLEYEQFKSSSICYEWLQKLYSKISQQNPQMSLIDCLFECFRQFSEQDLFWPKWGSIKQLFKLQSEKKICEIQDDSLLLHLIYFKHGFYPARSLQSAHELEHLMIDEVQDFGFVEIKALLQALKKDAVFTLMGDLGQKIFQNRLFDHWGEMVNQLQLSHLKPLNLNVSHRSSKSILRLACALRGEEFSEEIFKSSREGLSPRWISYENSSQKIQKIVEWASQTLEECPHALCAIICRYPKQAEELTAVLRQRGLSGVRFAHRDQFDFNPGIVITNAHQVKGLEFRRVLLVDVNTQNYPLDNTQGRNLLYVAVTRAEQQLDFLSDAPAQAPLDQFFAVGRGRF